MRLCLAVLGAGGHGRVIADTATVSGRWAEVKFYDDKPEQKPIAGRWIFAGDFNNFFNESPSCDAAIVGIGDNLARKTVQQRMAEKGIPVATVIHPNAFVSPRANLGIGTAVFAGVQIHIGAEIGDGCIVNTSATVDHDCFLGDFVHVSPGARIAGGVSVGREAWIGIGAVIKENVSIGDRAIVGAGSVVLKDVPNDTVVVGVPANRSL